MNDFTTVFEALKGLLPMKYFEDIVEYTNADHGAKKLTALRHLCILMYAHLKEKKSLRDITSGISADPNLQEYTGTISYSQLSRKNSDRDPEVFEQMFQAIVSQVVLYQGIRDIPSTWGDIKILDATLIRVCLSLFPWAHYRKAVGAVKMHTLIDLVSDCPEKIVITDGKIHDRDKMDSFVTKPGITYIFDRGYTDYGEYDRLCMDDIFFISRLKKNAVMEVVSENQVSRDSNVLSDKEVILGGFYTRMKNTVRIIEVMDISKGESFFIVTNRFDLSAEEIAQIYRLRWRVELFFKWIKQHLKIKRFYGTSYNAVLNQIYAALILYCVLKLLHIQLGSGYNFLEMVRLIAGGLWNPFMVLKETLKPTGQKSTRRRFNWKKTYKNLISQYRVEDIAFTA